LAIVALGAGGFGSWPIVSTPGLPPERLQTLRDGYAKTLQEPDLLEEAKKRGWELRPVGGEELQALAREVSVQPSDVVERMKRLMGS
jgi:tripartite-type tricarboxylate transporter receptor subunit TctC